MDSVNIQLTDEYFELTLEKFQAYQHIDLTNDFMFKHCISFKEILKPLLEELWNKEIGEIVEIISDHHIQPTQIHRSIYCDIYMKDSYGDIYILEMQKDPQGELRKRSKCYQSTCIFDQCTLESKRNEYYIAFLCCFDVSKIFLQEKFPCLEQVPKTLYRSDSILFVNLENYALMNNRRLQELFRFILHSDTTLHTSWDVVQLLMKKVIDIRRNKEMAGTYYVNEGRLEERYYDGVEFGEQRGYASAKADIVLRMYMNDMSIDMIAKCSGLDVTEIEKIITDSKAE